jgi:hypothetical protein
MISGGDKCVVIAVRVIFTEPPYVQPDLFNVRLDCFAEGKLVR